MRICQSFGCQKEPKGTSILCVAHGETYRAVLAARQERADVIDKFGYFNPRTLGAFRRIAT